MSSRWFLSGQTPVDANGTPYALGTLDFYITGTTTRTNVYSNAGLTSAVANPLTLGSDGLIPDIFLDQTRYKIVLKSATGTTINTFDPVDKSVERIKATAAPSPAYPGLQYHNTSDGHLYERDSTNATWIDRGAIDTLLNAASVSDVLTGTSSSLAVTPASLAGLWNSQTATISGGSISLSSSTGGGVFTCSTASTTLNSIGSATQGRRIRITFSNSQTITHGSGINVPGSLTTKVPAGIEIEFERGASSWTIINWTTGPTVTSARASNVVVTKTGGSTIAITADEALPMSTAGLVYRHTAVSVSVNLATTGANALDTGTQGTDWYSLWLISDGTTIAGLASISFSAPTMPSGYTYKVRVGSMHSTSTTLDGSKGYGNNNYVTGGAQTVDSTNSRSNTSTSLATFVPDTAIAGIFNLNCASNANGGAGVSPNNSYGTSLVAASATPPYLCCNGAASSQIGQVTGTVPLETAQTCFITTGSAGTNRVLLVGWVDNCPVT